MVGFKRKPQSDQVAIPEEIQEYYQTEKREHLGVAWLLALATFAVVVIGVLGLFFVGKWVYRTVNKDNGTKVQVVQTGNTSTDKTKDQPKPAPAPATTPTPTPQPTTPAPSTQTPKPTTTAPTTSSKNLVNTGPADVVELFTATTLAGGAAHSIYSAKKRRD